MLDNRTLQTWLKGSGFYVGEVDGQTGPQTRAAVTAAIAGIEDSATWSADRQRLAAEQMFLKDKGLDVGEIDGLIGVKTKNAQNTWITTQRNSEPPEAEVQHQTNTTWPRQKDVTSFYGNVGQHQTLLTVPYPLYYEGTLVKRISLHEKVAASAGRVLQKVLETYGQDKIHALALDVYDGSLNVRKMRGGSSWSMHSWGIAIDFDAEHNQLKMDHTRAKFAKSDYIPWFEAWEAEGWISLGRERDYDWMHVQAARL